MWFFFFSCQIYHKVNFASMITYRKWIKHFRNGCIAFIEMSIYKYFYYIYPLIILRTQKNFLVCSSYYMNVDD